MFVKNEEEYERNDEEYIIIENSAPRNQVEFTLQPIPSPLRFLLFLILFVLVAAFTLVRIIQHFLYRYSTAKSDNLLMKIFEAIRNMLLEFAELLRRLFGSGFSKTSESIVPMSYHEERISLSEISVYEKKLPTVKSYSDFKNKLDRISDPAERYRFAYAVMLKLAVDAYSLKPSDTPREASRFLAGKGWDEKISVQSTDYEFTAYSNEIPPEDRLESSLTEICYKVRSML